MNILVLQGPNLNLIGLRSAQTGEQITLDKINTGLRKHAHKINPEIQLKFLQTHKAEKAVSFVQRNRNKVDGVLIAPTSWGRFEFSLLEAISLVGLPSIQILLDNDYGTISKDDSIFSSICKESISGHPLTVFNHGLDILLDHISN
jgi:3-dehydroquinate dehydratase-2